jgi:carbamoyl-phosphate synthase small subunit
VYEDRHGDRAASGGFMSEAVLALADGTVFRGRAFGARAEAAGELVFNTSMTGYQEILTDPSYEGQLVAMTYPEIGTWASTSTTSSRRRPFVRGFIVREYRERPASWRAERAWATISRATAFPASTRSTRARSSAICATTGRRRRCCRASTSMPTPRQEGEGCAQDGRPGPRQPGHVQEAYGWTQGPWTLAGYASVDDVAERRGKAPLRVVAYDYGIKYNILRNLVGVGCAVRVVPASTPATRCSRQTRRRLPLERSGRPRRRPSRAQNVAELLGKVPVFGICLGHQILGLALGGTTYKLKFGHHGGNQPVKDLTTGKVEITVAEPRLRRRSRSLGDRAESRTST